MLHLVTERGSNTRVEFPEAIRGPWHPPSRRNYEQGSDYSIGRPKPKTFAATTSSRTRPGDQWNQKLA